MKRKSNNMV